MRQVKIVVSDDAAEFEEMINKELKVISSGYSYIELFKCDDWKFSCIIVYEVE